VVKVDAENNRLTVMDERGRLVEYDPKRLKGVAVYLEDVRDFSVGDRIQFRAPYPEKRITTNEIAYVERIASNRMTVRMDDEKQKQVTIDLSTYKHIDYGFATTSHGAQGLGAYRVIINANAYESAQLLNERMGYVANSRAERHVTIYTNSKADLPYALARTSDKETAIDAMLTSAERKELIQKQRASEIEQQRAQGPQIEQRQEQTRDTGGYGYSR
jgi:ATP-dependent exoDNAse (exonuclease V) alpha subunit